MDEHFDGVQCTRTSKIFSRLESAAPLSILALSSSYLSDTATQRSHKITISLIHVRLRCDAWSNCVWLKIPMNQNRYDLQKRSAQARGFMVELRARLCVVEESENEGSVLVFQMIFCVTCFVEQYEMRLSDIQWLMSRDNSGCKLSLLRNSKDMVNHMARSTEKITELKAWDENKMNWVWKSDFKACACFFNSELTKSFDNIFSIKLSTSCTYKHTMYTRSQLFSSFTESGCTFICAGGG